MSNFRLCFLRVFRVASAASLIFLCSPAIFAQAASDAARRLPADSLEASSGDAEFNRRECGLRMELDAEAERFSSGLKQGLAAKFDASQMDWLIYFEAERMAFRAGDAWTYYPAGDYPAGTGNAIISHEPSRAQNLYRENVIAALDFRLSQIKSFASGDFKLHPGGAFVIRPGERESARASLAIETGEAQYRVNTWTSERFRPRLYRAESAWETFFGGAVAFLESAGASSEDIAKAEDSMLIYRYDVLNRQREAMGRLKTEPED
jgi:hypothetical protein